MQRPRVIATAAGEGAALVLGTDLVKSPCTMLPAYDDHLGVVADFDKNMLACFNRQLGGRFDVDRSQHATSWNDEKSREPKSLVP